MLLTDLAHRDDRFAFDLGWDTWQRQVDLTDRIDTALVAHDVAGAAAFAAELTSTHRPSQHPLPVIDALIGRGEAARQDDQFEAAVQWLHEARTAADDASYRFGSMRSTLSLAYLTLQRGSAGDALPLFQEAGRTADELDDRVLLGGALVGTGEAFDKAGYPDDAVAALDIALETFESIRSFGGIVNASMHLGETHRRQRHTDAAKRAYERALDVAEAHGPWISTVNALDGLGEIHLAEGDLELAVEHYRDAYERSAERRYRRGQAHAANGLGRVHFAAGDYDGAVIGHSEARDHYLSLDDHLSVTSAYTGIADAHEAYGHNELAVEARLDAVDAIESVRSAQDRHRPQQEFIERFHAVYRSALRTAVRSGDVAAFIAVFEGLSGRRLAGLLDTTTATDNTAFDAQMLAFAHTRDAEPTTPSERAARLLGRTALRATLPSLVSDGIDDVAAALYTKFDRASAPALLRALVGTNLFAICALPGAAREAVALTIEGSTTTLHEWHLPEPTAHLAATLARHGLAPDARLVDLEPLTHLIPTGWTPPPGELLIIPLETMWSVPWPAVLDAHGAPLGETHPLVVAPSRTLASRTRRPTTAASPIRAATWRSPHVDRIDIHAFRDDSRIEHQPLPDASSAKEATISSRTDLVALVAHGTPIEGLRHILELDDDVYLTPVDLMSATVPDRLALIACWGAHTPDGPGGEPLTLATIAAARGAEVLCTISELADDVPASQFVNNVLHHALDMSFAEAVHAATITFLGNERRRRGILSRWATIITVSAARAPTG